MSISLLTNPYKCNKLYVYNKGGRNLLLIEFNSVAYIKQTFGDKKRITVSKEKIEQTKINLKKYLVKTFNYK